MNKELLTIYIICGILAISCVILAVELIKSARQVKEYKTINDKILESSAEVTTKYSDAKAELDGLKSRIVELHEILTEKNSEEGQLRYIGMRFQNEIKPYITQNRNAKRWILTVLKPEEE